MARTRVLLLTYDASALEAGLGVVCAAAGPVQSSAKEPVGHGFHHKQLLQAGVIGETFQRNISLRCECITRTNNQWGLAGG